MNVFKKWSMLTFAVLCFSALTACGNSNASENQEQNNVEVQEESLTQKQPEAKAGNSPVQSELDKAKQEGKAVFVVVTGTDVEDTGKAKEIAKGASEIYKNSVVVKMNRDNEANASLVAEWRLAGAPVPLILVLSSKGMPTGGLLLSQATPEKVASLVPSPKLEKVYDAINSGKNAIVAFTKKSFTDRAEVLKECNEAVKMLEDEAVFVEVDMNDSKEAGFLNQVRIDKNTTDASVTLVINKQGQVAGTSTTIPSAEKLVSAANTPVQGGCGPGCGPAGCGK